MDHRCLYGHRVPGDYRFAIERNACPVCGAELVSLDGYKLARALVTEAQLDAVTAFRTAKVLEKRFVITPREGEPAPAAAAAPAPAKAGAAKAAATPKAATKGSAKAATKDAAPTSGEARLDQEDLTDPAAAGVATPSAPLVDELEDAESVELISTDADDAAPVPAVADTGFDAVEESFFSSSP